TTATDQLALFTTGRPDRNERVRAPSADSNRAPLPIGTFHTDRESNGWSAATRDPEGTTGSGAGATVAGAFGAGVGRVGAGGSVAAGCLGSVVARAEGSGVVGAPDPSATSGAAVTAPEAPPCGSCAPEAAAASPGSAASTPSPPSG